MSSTDYGSTIDLMLRPSSKAVRVLLALHLLAIGLTILCNPPKLAGCVIAVLIALSWVLLRRHPSIGVGPKSLVRLVWNVDGRWQVEEATGARHAAQLLPGSLMVPCWLTVLNFKLENGQRRTRILLGDEIGCEPQRRLRARLLSARSPDSAGALAAGRDPG